MPHTFALPFAIPPGFDPAFITPDTFSPGSGRTVSIAVKYYENCNRSVQILSVSDQNPTTQLIRSLVPMSNRDAGTGQITWDDSTDAGPLATTVDTPYMHAEHPSVSTRPSNAQIGLLSTRDLIAGLKTQADSEIEGN
ncbi:MAG: hypothetical protein JWO48_425 [Bryobacterales bacterium]|nr:hypothetical protein [Bryobacterales bacterium]